MTVQVTGDPSVRSRRPETAEEGPVGILQISVEGLFGQFDYTLESETTDLSDLFILYGDNGAGKTTILKLLFHLLSAGRNRGHRSAIKRTAFKLFEVRLVNRTKMRLSREAP